MPPMTPTAANIMFASGSPSDAKGTGVELNRRQMLIAASAAPVVGRHEAAPLPLGAVSEEEAYWA